MQVYGKFRASPKEATLSRLLFEKDAASCTESSAGPPASQYMDAFSGLKNYFNKVKKEVLKKGVILINDFKK